MRSTPEQIEEMLNPYGLSLSTLPKPSFDYYAYEGEDRSVAESLAQEWEGGGGKPYSVLGDFICHQCDVIELLMSALIIANRRLKNE